MCVQPVCCCCFCLLAANQVRASLSGSTAAYVKTSCVKGGQESYCITAGLLRPVRLVMDNS